MNSSFSFLNAGKQSVLATQNNSKDDGNLENIFLHAIKIYEYSFAGPEIQVSCLGAT